MDADVDTISGNFGGNISQVSYYNLVREASPWAKWALGAALASTSYVVVSHFFF